MPNLPIPALRPEERQFIESVGVTVEGLGVPRIAGRVVGLMLLAQRPLALDEIASLLRVSRGSVSINTRLLIAGGVLKPCAYGEDRRRFYTIEPQMFERRIELLDRSLGVMRELTAEGLAAISPDNQAARQRLTSANLFATFLGGQIHELVPKMRELFATPDPAGAR